MLLRHPTKEDRYAENHHRLYVSHSRCQCVIVKPSERKGSCESSDVTPCGQSQPMHQLMHFHGLPKGPTSEHVRSCVDIIIIFLSSFPFSSSLSISYPLPRRPPHHLVIILQTDRINQPSHSWRLCNSDMGPIQGSMHCHKTGDNS